MSHQARRILRDDDRPLARGAGAGTRRHKEAVAVAHHRSHAVAPDRQPDRARIAAPERRLEPSPAWRDRAVRNGGATVPPEPFTGLALDDPGEMRVANGSPLLEEPCPAIRAEPGPQRVNRRVPGCDEATDDRAKVDRRGIRARPRSDRSRL